MIQWFPGHMKKTQEMLSQQIKKVDLVLEVLDARTPIVKNPLLEKISFSCKKIILLNKLDLADKKQILVWQQFYKNFYKEKTPSLLINAHQNSFHQLLWREVKKIFQKEKWFNKRSIQTLVLGLPNTGKSTIINSLVGKKKTLVGDRPGITRSKQWVSDNKKFNFLDTPGILWHKLDDSNIAHQVAIVGSIKDNLFDKQEICYQLLIFLICFYKENFFSMLPAQIVSQFKKELAKEKGKKIIKELNYQELTEATIKLFFEIFCFHHGFYLKNKTLHLERAYSFFLGQFRKGKYGRVVLSRDKKFPFNIR